MNFRPLPSLEEMIGTLRNRGKLKEFLPAATDFCYISAMKGMLRPIALLLFLTGLVSAQQTCDDLLHGLKPGISRKSVEKKFKLSATDKAATETIKFEGIEYELVFSENILWRITARFPKGAFTTVDQFTAALAPDLKPPCKWLPGTREQTNEAARQIEDLDAELEIARGELPKLQKQYGDDHKHVKDIKERIEGYLHRRRVMLELTRETRYLQCSYYSYALIDENGRPVFVVEARSVEI